MQADLRDPPGILDHPDLRACFDLRQPTAVLLIEVPHFFPDEQPPRAVSFLKAAMAPGSYLVVPHGTEDNLGPGAVQKPRQVYAGAAAPTAPRALAGTTRFSGGPRMMPPGPCNARPGETSQVRASPDRTPVSRWHREEAVLTLTSRTCQRHGRSGAGGVTTPGLTAPNRGFRRAVGAPSPLVGKGSRYA